MAHQNGLPVCQGLLCRPRLHAAIRQGLQHPLLVMLAGPGYGKTQAMTDYLAQSDTQALWLCLNSHDNLSTYFWDHLVRALQKDSPAVSERLRALEFPDTPARLDAFLQILADDLQKHGPAVWVFDDFGEITDRRVKALFGALVEAELGGLRIVLMSDALDRTESVAFMTDKRFLMLGKDLCFTGDEIAALFAQGGAQLGPEELADIRRCTEGRPLVLHLLAMRRAGQRAPARCEGPLDSRGIFHMVEELYYAACPKRRQRLLIKLSLLGSFTARLAAGLCEGGGQEEADLAWLTGHLFVTGEPATGRLVFHELYRQFLQEKQPLLSAQEQRAVWRSAAEYHLRAGNPIEAISCYRSGEDRIGMLSAIREYVGQNHSINAHGITSGNAAFFLEHLDLLTPGEAREHPVAGYLRAVIYINTLELDKAEALLLDLERRLPHAGTPEARALLGEACAMLGALHMMRNREDFGSYYEKAAGYLPNGTRLQSENSLLTQNNHSFSMPDSSPGAKERMERAVHATIPWVNRVLCGRMGGMEHIYSAEAAYLSHQFDNARQHAYRGIYKAEANAQHDLVCNGYCLLARIALMQGRLPEMTQQIESVDAYVAQHDNGVLRDIRDTLLGWYYVKLRDYKRVPHSILTMTRSERPLMAHDRSQIIFATYLLSTGKFARLVGMLEYPVGLYITEGIWQDTIIRNIMLAIGYQRLGNPEAAVEALWAAYDMTYSNGLVTLFVEAEEQMRALVDLARQQTARAFDPAWLDLIYRLATDFSRRAGAVRAAYKKQSPAGAMHDNPLTRRELDVLRALTMGMTREEIAAQQFISVNTVKTFIRNIYAKLNAANRAEAVSIALSRGYIDGPVL